MEYTVHLPLKRNLKKIIDCLTSRDMYDHEGLLYRVREKIKRKRTTV